VAKDLFVNKVTMRVEQFLDMPEGRRINALAAAAHPGLDVETQLARYLELYSKREQGFSSEHLVVGHGDPCFSNVLYDQPRQLLKLIDPKGAAVSEDIWTHPLYDLCKFSHSALGDYDFINSGLYRLGFTDTNHLTLDIAYSNQPQLKPVFLRLVADLGHDVSVMRLAEASLFLSMLPLHIDHPNKAMAFLLKAHTILDEVEESKDAKR
jgi:hypothetical protein